MPRDRRGWPSADAACYGRLMASALLAGVVALTGAGRSHAELMTSAREVAGLLRESRARRKCEPATAPNIPPKANRCWKDCFSPYLYRNRNAIERMCSCADGENSGPVSDARVLSEDGGLRHRV